MLPMAPSQKLVSSINRSGANKIIRPIITSKAALIREIRVTKT
jgi:hypothetical protein